MRLFNARRRFRHHFKKAIRGGKMPELVQWVKRKSSLGVSRSSG
jgi:hypothetical protein